MFKKKIDELAKELLEKVLQIYRKRHKWDTRSLSMIIEEELKKFNEKVKELLEEKIYELLGNLYFENTNREIAVTPVLLSEMLYKNAKDVSALVTKILIDAIRAKATVRETAKKLYEGYGFKDEEVLKVIEELPKYIKDELMRPKNQKAIMKKIEKLKTKPLKIAYKEIFRKLEEMEYEAIDKAMKAALYEKSRFYAVRIAETEIHRARMSARALDYLNDNEVEFVKYELSSSHPKTDICDFYAELDLGWGRGVYPKKEMRALPLHPFCRCVYAPYYPKKGKRVSWREAVEKTMSKFSEKEQREILGSKDKLIRFKNGEDIESIFNSLRPKYPIMRYVDLFGYDFKIEYYKKDLVKFIDEIKIKNIKRNEVVIGEFERKVIEFLQNKGIENNQEIFLSVRRYFHILRDFKKAKNKAIPENIIKNFPIYLANPLRIYFDNHKKHKNLIFVFEYKKKLYKIVVNPSGEIITAGNVNTGNLEKDSLFEEIKR